MGERIFKGNSTFSSEPAFLKAVDRMLTFKKKGYIPEGAEGMNIDQALSHFGTGKAAMFFGGAWYYSSLTKANADLNILPMPMPANDKGTLSIIDSVLEGLTINSKAKEKAAAAKLLAWFGTPEVAAKHLQFSGGGSTPIRGASEFIPDTRATKSIRELGKYVEQMGSVRFDQQPYTPTAFGRDVQSRIFDVIRETMVTGGTAQDVAKQLDELLKQTK
jgi:ABC-type glycerol-3-phosphate transport system substrate-binding protein